MTTQLIRMMILVISVLLVGCAPQTKPTQAHTKESFSDIAEKMKKSLVYVQVGTDKSDLFSKGSGFITYVDTIRGTVLIITANHLLSEPVIDDDSVEYNPDTSKITIAFAELDNPYKSKLVSKNIELDIAILRISVSQNKAVEYYARVVSLSKTSNIRVGADVGNVSYNLMLESDGEIKRPMPLVDHGIISSVYNRSNLNENNAIAWFSTNMPLIDGASGSPVFLRSSGEVIGMMVEFRCEKTPTGVVSLGISYCRPSNSLEELLLSVISELNK